MKTWVDSETQFKHPDSPLSFFIAYKEKQSKKKNLLHRSGVRLIMKMMVSSVCEYLSPSSPLSTNYKICGSLNVCVDTVCCLFWLWQTTRCHRSLVSELLVLSKQEVTPPSTERRAHSGRSGFRSFHIHCSSGGQRTTHLFCNSVCRRVSVGLNKLKLKLFKTIMDEI